MTKATSHVLIIGAGFGGLSAAVEIARGMTGKAAQITVIERLGVGSNHTTPMTFADTPATFGLQESVIGRYRRFTFHSPLGGRCSHDFDGSPLVALDYAQAARSLCQRAQQAGDVHILHASASHLQRCNGIWELTLADGRSLRAPLLIDASGRGLFTHKALGLPRPREFSHCYGALLHEVDVPDPHEAFFWAPYDAYGDGGGWLYPLDNGCASVGYASLGGAPAFPAGEVMLRFRQALQTFEPYPSWLRHARWERPEVGSIPIYPLRRLVYDGLLIVGDAAGQATIWSCMGSAAALEAGQMAGQAAIWALQHNDFGAKSLQSYQRNWDARHRRIYRNNAILAPVVWGMSAAEWNRQIGRVQALLPNQMLERLRTNWPVPAWPIAVFLRAYDIAGRIRRALAARLLPK